MTDPYRTKTAADLAAARLADPFHEGAAAARARRTRSLAIALGLILFVALIFAVSILRLSQNAKLAAQATGRPPPTAAAPAGATTAAPGSDHGR